MIQPSEPSKPSFESYSLYTIALKSEHRTPYFALLYSESAQVPLPGTEITGFVWKIDRSHNVFKWTMTNGDLIKFRAETLILAVRIGELRWLEEAARRDSSTIAGIIKRHLQSVEFPQMSIGETSPRLKWTMHAIESLKERGILDDDDDIITSRLTKRLTDDYDSIVKGTRG